MTTLTLDEALENIAHATYRCWIEHATPANTSENHTVRPADGPAGAKCVLGGVGA